MTTPHIPELAAPPVAYIVRSHPADSQFSIYDRSSGETKLAGKTTGARFNGWLYLWDAVHGLIPADYTNPAPPPAPSLPAELTVNGVMYRRA